MKLKLVSNDINPVKSGHARPFHTYYTNSRASPAGPKHWDARGAACTQQGALLAAVRRLHSGDYTRCDVYGLAGRALWSVYKYQSRIIIQRANWHSKGFK